MHKGVGPSQEANGIFVKIPSETKRKGRTMTFKC